MLKRLAKFCSILLVEISYFHLVRELHWLLRWFTRADADRGTHPFVADRGDFRCCKCRCCWDGWLCGQFAKFMAEKRWKMKKIGDKKKTGSDPRSARPGFSLDTVSLSRYEAFISVNSIKQHPPSPVDIGQWSLIRVRLPICQILLSERRLKKRRKQLPVMRMMKAPSAKIGRRNRK